jgi:uncharacterized sodium:solute symporter family permease YidK
MLSLNRELMTGPMMNTLIGNFLNRMAITFAACILMMLLMTLLNPLKQPVEFKLNTTIELHTSKGAKVCGVLVVLATLVLYFIFSPWGLIK